MKKMTAYGLVGLVLCAWVFAGCGDKNEPGYWLKRMDEKVYRAESLKKVEELFHQRLRENGNNPEAPAVKQFLDVAVEGLVQAYDKYSSDRVTQEDIIKILSAMGDRRAEKVFLAALTYEENSENKQFNAATNALARFKTAQAIAPLLAAHKKIVASRRGRGSGASNTPGENFAEHAIITALGDILVANPDAPERAEAVRTLIEAMETSDEEHELKINLEAMKVLGRLGDPAAVPALVRGIFFIGKKQKVGLGEVAFSALQQISDPSAVANGLIKMAKGEDEAFNRYIQGEKDVDPRMPVQQAMVLLGLLQYRSDAVKDFLMAELTRDKPDDVDKKPNLEGRPQFTPEEWMAFRHNWAAVALAQLGYDELFSILERRLVFKGDMIQTPPLELPGYIDALYYLLNPDKAVPILKKIAKVDDDSLKMRSMLRLSQLGSFEDFAFGREIYEKYPDCPPIEEQPQCLKNDLKDYLVRLEAAENCKDADGWTGKLEHENWRVREKAVIMLGVLAQKDTGLRDKVVPVLVKRLDDPSTEVNNAAIMVLDRITQPPQGCPECLPAINRIRDDLQKRGAAKGKIRDLDSFEGRVKARTKA